MFFHRRRPNYLLHLILAFLGFKAFRHHLTEDPARKEAMKAKGQKFHAKLQEAFAVWHETEPEPAEAAAAPAEQQS